VHHNENVGDEFEIIPSDMSHMDLRQNGRVVFAIRVDARGQSRRYYLRPEAPN